jgi:hypothetical protein
MPYTWSVIVSPRWHILSPPQHTLQLRTWWSYTSGTYGSPMEYLRSITQTEAPRSQQITPGASSRPLGIDQRFSTAYHPQTQGQVDVMKPPTPRFFPIFPGHFDTHFVFLCFQPQSHQPQRSGSPASRVRLTSLRDQAPSLNSQAHHHLPPRQARPPPATMSVSI